MEEVDLEHPDRHSTEVLLREIICFEDPDDTLLVHTTEDGKFEVSQGYSEVGVGSTFRTALLDYIRKYTANEC